MFSHEQTERVHVGRNPRTISLLARELHAGFVGLCLVPGGSALALRLPRCCVPVRTHTLGQEKLSPSPHLRLKRAHLHMVARPENLSRPIGKATFVLLWWRFLKVKMVILF